MSTHAALPTVEEALFSEQNGREIEDMYASVVIGGYSGGVRLCVDSPAVVQRER